MIAIGGVWTVTVYSGTRTRTRLFVSLPPHSTCSSSSLLSFFPAFCCPSLFSRVQYTLSVIYAGIDTTASIPGLDYLRAHPSAALPPSPLNPNMLARPRAPTPSNLQTSDEWPAEYNESYEPVSPSPSSAYIVDSPSNILPPAPRFHNTLSRTVSEEEETSFASDSGHAHSPVRSPKISGLPDPSQYPDPYPFRPPHWVQGISTPALSSADSSSASTRSSAYTNSARSGDYGHVHIQSGNDEPDVGVGITTDDVVQLLAKDQANASSVSQRRLPPDISRYSDLYANSVRSRSSSGGHAKHDSIHENDPPRLRTTPSFDVSWRTVDERDEMGLTSEDDTDDYGANEDEEDDLQADDEGDDELPTSAMIIAEEGLGVIVRGDNIPIHQLQIKPGKSSSL